MANVGNLFVNISGNTKGLTKSLGKAKRSIQGFGKEAMAAFGGGGMSRKAAKKASSMFDVLGVKAAGQQAEGDLKGAKATNKLRALFKPGAEQHERYSQAKARMVTSATLGVLGLTVAGVSMMASKALSQISSAKEGAEKFQYLGPQGGEIIKAKVATMMADIAAAKDPAVSQAFLEREKARLTARETATAAGATAISIGVDEFFERMGTAFIVGVEGVIKRPMDFIAFPLTYLFSGTNPFETPNPRPTAGAAPP
jgi:hypothetical protein|tara:strand:- start:2129 stop:2893 length:765 start_codon:yes stop_codon:yes gene_type:complete